MSRFRVWYAAQPRGLRLLVTINVVCYLLWQVVLIHIGPVRAFVWDHLALNPGLPGILFEPWQLLTYGFLHLQPGFGGLLHVGFNMLWLWWIGRDLEDLQGPQMVTAVYILGAVGGALLTVLLSALFPAAGMFSALVHGASGGVLGVMATVGILYPFKRIGLLFIGSVRIIHIVIGLLALDILFLAAGGTSLSAHFGGALTGAAIARLQQVGTNVTGWASLFFPTGRRSGSRQSFLQRMESWLAGRKDSSRSSRKSNMTIVKPAARAGHVPEETESVDIDGILDKISAQGYDALTPAEKKALYEASQEG